MSNIEDMSFVIQTGNPSFIYGGSKGRLKKDNELIRTVKRLDVGQYIHIPTAKGNEKEIRRIAKNTVATARMHLKTTNPNIRYSYGVATCDNVYGVSIVRIPDVESKSSKLVF